MKIGLGLGLSLGRSPAAVHGVPSNLVSSLIANWRADAVVSSSGEVTQLTDLSGNAKHATRDTGDTGPSLIANGVSTGKPSIRFNGAERLLHNLTNILPLTIFFVAKRYDSHSGACGHFSTKGLSNGEATGGIVMKLISTGNHWSIHTWNGDQVSSYTLDSFTAGVASIAAYNDIKLYTDTNTVESKTGGGLSYSTLGYLGYGPDGSSNSFSFAEVAQHGLLNKAVDATEAAKLIAALKKDWGL